MTFRDMDYFLALSEEKSFYAASKKLFITQQGLSKAIRALEDELGFPLFQRGRRQVSLTKYGRKLYPYALEVRALRSRMDRCIESLRAQTSRVRLGVTMGVLLALPRGTLDGLRAALAPYALELSETTDLSCEEGVKNGELDFGVTVSPVPAELLVELPLKTSPMYAVLRAEHPLAEKKSIRFEDLKNERIILANQQFKSYYNFLDGCRAHGFEPEIAATTMEMMMIYHSTLQYGWAGITADMPNSRLDYPGVALLPFPREEFSCRLSLIYARDRLLTESDRLLRDTIAHFMCQTSSQPPSLYL